MIILRETLYRFIKHSLAVFKDMDKLLLKFMWSNRIPRITEAILAKTKMEDFSFPNIKLYYEIIVIKTVVYFILYSLPFYNFFCCCCCYFLGGPHRMVLCTQELFLEGSKDPVECCRSNASWPHANQMPYLLYYHWTSIL